MKKAVVQIAIIVTVVIIVFPLALTAHRSYSGQQQIDWDNASKALTFDLLKGENVEGSFSIINGYNETGYRLYNQDVGEVIIQNTYNRQANFDFTACIDGLYYLSIQHDKPFGISVVYSYTISSAFLGFDYTVWIGFIIAIGLVLVLIVTLRSHYKKKAK
jgi:hypothetical protein